MHCQCRNYKLLGIWSVTLSQKAQGPEYNTIFHQLIMSVTL